MQLKDVMTRDVEVVSPDASILEAARTMKRLDVGPLPVCDGERLLGVITDRDIAVRGVADARDPDRTKVRQIMTSDVEYCFEDEDVAHAARMMQEAQIRRLMVLDRENISSGSLL